MVTAIEELAHASATLDEEGANALGCVEFVAGEGKQVELEGLYVDRYLSDGLHRVGVEVDVGVRSDAANFRKRLNGAEFVVGVHDGDEDGVWAYGIAQIVEL